MSHQDLIERHHQQHQQCPDFFDLRYPQDDIAAAGGGDSVGYGGGAFVDVVGAGSGCFLVDNFDSVDTDRGYCL